MIERSVLGSDAVYRYHYFSNLLRLHADINKKFQSKIWEEAASLQLNSPY